MVLATVCARKGSEGVRGKNVRPIAGGDSLLARTMQFASALVRAEIVGSVVVSTDIEIPEPDFGFWLRKRPEPLRGGDVSKWLVLRDAIEWFEEGGTNPPVSAVLDLDVTRPIRLVPDCEALLDLFRRKHPALALTVSESSKSPYFDLWEPTFPRYPEAHPNEAGPLTLSKGDYWAPSRQSVPTAYVWAGEWVIDRDYLFETDPSQVFGGTALGYIVPRAFSYDVDDELDWTILEYLLTERGDV